MGIQAQLDSDAISMLPLLSAAMKTARQYVRDQMTACALREIWNASPCLAEMDQLQIEALDEYLMTRFRFYAAQ